MVTDVVTKLNASRRELLDLGLRNPLLNYRARVNKIDIIDNHSVDLYRFLVMENKSTTFLAVPEHEKKENEEVLSLLPDADTGLHTQFPKSDSQVIEGTQDNLSTYGRLQTKLVSEHLHTKLLGILNNAETYIEEQGVNILYLALGFLHWHESDNSDQVRLAPLILLPVSLSRENARARFRLNYTEEEITANLSLVEKLKNEFAIKIPEITDTDSFDVAEYHKEIASRIKAQSKWKVEPDEIVLGFFSFGKFLMYKDLGEDQWLDGKKPSEHQILRALLEDGFKDPPIALPDDTFIDECLSPHDNLQVVDADSTQVLAILDVKAGHNLVIQGPPGTGKSQTITNIIAESIGSGKKVLFVSEKMAALDVVKRRLDNIGLGDAVLELHSHKTNKRAVLKELERTLDLGKPAVKTAMDDIATFVSLRDRLNAYCVAVNTTILDSGVTPYKALGAYINLGDITSFPQMDFSVMSSWTQTRYRESRLAVEELQHRLEQIGVPSKNPFWGTQRTVLLPSDETKIINLLKQTETSVGLLQDHANALAAILQLGTPQTYTEVTGLCQAVFHIMDVPDFIGVQVNSSDWHLRYEDLKRLIAIGNTLSTLHQRFDGYLKPEAWEQNLEVVRQYYLTYGDRWWRFLSGKYRLANKHLARICKQPLPKEIMGCVEIIDAVQEARKQSRLYEQHEPIGKLLFRTRWKGLSSNWAELSRLLEWLASTHRDIKNNRLPTSLIEYLSRAPDLKALRSQYEVVKQDLSHQLELIEKVAMELGFHNTDGKTNENRNEIALLELPIAKQQEQLQIWCVRFNDLQALASYNLLAKQLQGLGLSTVLEVAEAWDDAAKSLLRAFDATWFGGLIDTAFKEREPLQQFERTSHEYAINKFRELDKLLFTHNRARLALQHWDHLPRYEQGELRIVKREINKKRGHLPIRQLLDKAGHAIQAVKPVFMMGPLSIANFLKPGHLDFDLVIFDEASQVKPVDALGAILRGKQAVVVGDSKQLPPTNFFDSLVGEIAEDEQNESVTVDLESILGLFAAQNAPERMLRWHYRSRHESLIAVSNYEFYDNKLVVFPSPISSETSLGLRFNHLPNTYYDRGKTRTNPEEAKALAAAVIRYAKKHPELTLGVVAFSTAQRDAIMFQLELMRRRDSSCEEFFSGHQYEPFFIKNLENVQGDERDVILISVGYGKTVEGYMSMSFGPLNQEGGERRLNVLITRARQICEVFANFTSADIDLHRTNARGIVALKNFLSYAQNRILEMPFSTHRDTDSPFEDAVIKELHGLGYMSEPQVGCAGFRIDIGVIDPAKSGRYLLGIECDGASYHSARSARDRDRLRQEVLENLGWRIHRIWSTAWFRDSKKELVRLVEAIEQAKIHWKLVDDKQSISTKSNSSTGVTTVIDRHDVDNPTLNQITVRPYVTAKLRIKLFGRELHELGSADVAAYVQEVVAVESPVHIDDVINRIAEAVGIKRVGSRIQLALNRGIEKAIRSDAIRKNGDFLWRPDASEIVVRDRSSLDAASRNLQLVAPQEIRAALKQVVNSAFSIRKDDALSASLELLGFQRVTATARELISRVVEESIQQGEFIELNGLLKLA